MIDSIKQVFSDEFSRKPSLSLMKSDQNSKTDTNPTSGAQVVITKDGFNPSIITVAKGQQVTWVNKDQAPHQVIYYADADIPNLPSLDSESLGPNDSFTFTFEKKGTFTYKNRLNILKFKGTVIVK